MIFWILQSRIIMKNKLKYEVTPISLEYFKQRSFEIIFDVFNNMNSLENELVKEYLTSIGNAEFYESLKYHNDIMFSAMLTKNYQLIENFFIWKYSVCISRNIDVDCFLQEYELWKESILSHLYPSHSSEINVMYDYLILHHNRFKKKAIKTKKITVNKEYEELFEELLIALQKVQKEEFKKLIKNNFDQFNNNIFFFIEEVIDPLMYKIGQMWQLNEISVSKEHLVTSFVDEIVDEHIKNNLAVNDNKTLVITSTVGNESHNLGIKIVGKFIETYGYNVKNLSSEISIRELINSIYKLKPSLVVLSVTLPQNIAILQEVVKELKSDINLFSGKIIVGGQGLFVGKNKISIKEADFCTKNLEDLKEFLILHNPSKS